MYYPFSGPDDDGDGLPNYLELDIGLNPLDANTDDDGIPDGIEDKNRNGQIDDDETDPADRDSDDDGIQDGTELGYTEADVGPDTDMTWFQPDLDPSTTTDPLNQDTDQDGIPDGDEDENHNGRVDAGESNPAALLPAVLSIKFGTTDCVGATPCHADLDHDGDVDGSDLAIFCQDNNGGL